TKVTTFILPLFATCVIGGLHLLQFLNAKRTGQGSGGTSTPETGNRNVDRRSRCTNPALPTVQPIGLLLLLILPVLVGYAYVHYSDSIKDQIEYTAWLSSHHPYTRNWTYGTWEQRLKIRNWDLIWIRALRTTLPTLGLAVCIGFFVLPFRLRQFR